MTTAGAPRPATPDPDQIHAGWDRVADGFDAFVTPLSIDFGRQALTHVDVGPGTRFLDVAAGSGALAIPAARAGARVVATDFSPLMVERLAARAQQQGLEGLEARVMDGNSLELEDDSFDVAASQNGVSLFEDVDRGLAELARVTRPGGQVLVVAFGPLQQAEFLTFFIGAIRAAVPGVAGPPMDPPPLPFQLADPELLRGKLADAGLGQVRVETAVWEMTVESAEHAWDAVTHSNPIGMQIADGLTDRQIDDTLRVLEGMLRERSGGSPRAAVTTVMNIGVGRA